VTGSLTESAEVGLGLLRRLSTAIADAFTADEVARAALSTALEIPGVDRAGIALDAAGGRQLQFVSSDDDALTPNRVRWCLIDAFADLPLVAAVRHGRDLFFGGAEQLDAAYPGFAARQRELGTRSLVALSMGTQTERVGGLMLAFDEEQEFGPEQRWLLSAFASQVTQSLRKGIAYQAQHTTAEQLQRSLMPRSLPELPGVGFGSHYRPGGLNSGVGGDWYDVLVLPDGRTAFVVGDVMGKGTAAAIVMSEMRASLRAYALLDPAPTAVLARMDALVASSAFPEQLVTLAYGILSADRRAVTLGLAGHPPPLLVTASGVRALDDGTGAALGVGAGPWSESTVGLGPEDVLLLYSDGLVERRDRELDAGIRELVTHVEEIPGRRRQPRELCTRLAHLMTDEHSDDDVTLLALGIKGAGWLDASLRLPDDTTAPREARRFVRDTLSGWGVCEDDIDGAELCVSELVTNAVIHTGTAAELTVQLDPEFLTVLVRDSGSAGTVQPTEDDDPLMVSGRGLSLVDALATAWSAEHGADGTTVWFEIERSDAA
jgi:serine phosphatase RsbU (regulator of sigma subunit)/anti-sigma regulatory factor (Ser/Thr protein kinase)